MQIVVLDGYTENPGDLSWKPLEELGDLIVYDRTSFVDSPIIAERIGNAEIVVVNKTPITRTTLDTCPNIRLIAVLATGYNIVDCAAAKEKGIPVVNAPTYGTAAVSQYSIALLLEICHHIGHHNASVHAGNWSKNVDWCYWDYPLIELEGKTLGVIGFGRIGQSEGRIASALGMRVLACDPYPNEKGKEIAEYVSLDELFARSDVISLHCNLTELVNEKDLADALHSGKVAAAALDVVSTEPIHEDNPLLTAPNCIITPHISWAAKESRGRIMDITADNIQSFLNGNPKNVVNR